MPTISLFDWVKNRRLDESDDEDEDDEDDNDATDKGKAAFESSKGASMKSHVDAHRKAGNMHKDAFEAYQKEGNAKAAHAHDQASKDHFDVADKMEKDYKDSKMFY